MPNSKEKLLEDCNVEIENFGPIFEGKISIKPLTIFIGSNNSGKSYASMLLHSIFGATDYAMRTFFQGWRGGYSPNLLVILAFSKIDNKEIKEISKILNDSFQSKSKEVKIPKILIEKILTRIISFFYEDVLEKKLTYSFASNLEDLIRKGETSFKINFNNLCLQYKNKLEIINYPDMGLKYDLESPRLFNIKIFDEDHVILKVKSLKLPGEDEELIEFIVSEIITEMLSQLLNNLRHDSYYLPAARSGIVQAQRVLAANTFRLSFRAGIEDISIPSFSGVIADFLSSLQDLDREKGPFARLANQFTNEIIYGDIIVDYPNKESNNPEIKYEYDGMKIPLHRSSSTVSELAPLFLYLRYLAKPKGILIIEEPEAHLHPKNQRILAKYLIRMMKMGLKIIITTHSDYLLDQLNNFILLSKLDKNEREKYGYKTNDYLNASDVSIYLFDYDSISKGNKIQEIEINKEGITEESFTEVLDALYDETNKIRRELSRLEAHDN